MEKLTLVLMLFISLLLLSSCGPDDDDANGVREETEQEENEDDSGDRRNLFRNWKSVDGFFTFDLSGGTFNNPRGRVFSLNSGELCRCTVVVNGTQDQGQIRISSCSYSGGGFGDPDCVNIWENNGLPYSFTQSDRSLKICGTPSSCRFFR